MGGAGLRRPRCAICRGVITSDPPASPAMPTTSLTGLTTPTFSGPASSVPPGTAPGTTTPAALLTQIVSWMITYAGPWTIRPSPG